MEMTKLYYAGLVDEQEKASKRIDGSADRDPKKYGILYSSLYLKNMIKKPLKMVMNPFIYSTIHVYMGTQKHH